MQKEDEALRGFMVGEARGLLESQRRIEKKVGTVSILSIIAIALILAVLAVNTRTFTRLKGATNSITAASISLSSLAGQIQSGLKNSRSDISILTRRVDSLDSRIGKWESGTASSGKTYETGKVSGSAKAAAADQETTKKKKGCLGIF